MELSVAQLLEVAQFSLSRLDGAWFMAIAKEEGIDTAWKIDVKAWSQFAYIFGKKMRRDYFHRPVWPESYLDAMGILATILGVKGREVVVEGDFITIKVTDCEIQKAIAKAGVADCGIVTVKTYKEMARGLFDKEMDISVKHTKNLNRGDRWCEVVINATPNRI